MKNPKMYLSPDVETIVLNIGERLLSSSPVDAGGENENMTEFDLFETN